MTAYIQGQQHALEKLGKLSLRCAQNPFSEIQKKLVSAFKVKSPEMDVSKLLKRLLNNPFGQPRKHLSGQWPGLRV